MPQATVVIPTFDHGPMLLYSVGSTLAQTIEDIEVFVVGDGVPDMTREIMAGLTKEDDRMRFFDNPKAPSRGELHRNAALEEARGEIVCYLADDDLWFPEHVEAMRDLLGSADFANTLPIYVDEEGALGFYIVDLALPADRDLILSGTNRIPLSCGAHTLEMYRRLPHGWRTTPKGKPTDLHMWQQFLSDPGCRAVSHTRPTALNFPSPRRASWTVEERVGELEEWSLKIADPRWRDGFVFEAFDTLVREYASEMARMRADIGNYQRWLHDLRDQQRRRVDNLKIRLVEKHRETARLNTRVRDLTRQIHDIQDSTSWRLLARLGSFKNKLFGTRG